MNKDTILHALISDSRVQVCLISGKNMVTEAQKIHGLSRVATAALGRQMMMTSMMGSRLKNEDDRVSSVIRGEGGYTSSMVCTAFPNGDIKAWTQEPIAELPPTAEGKLDVGGYVGHTGKLTVIRDLGFGEPYVGVCNLVGGEIAMDFAQYYTVSEQQPSICYLGVRVDIETGEVRSAGGALVQPLPGCPDEIIDALTERAGDISGLSRMLEDGISLEDALEKLFGDFLPEKTAEYSPSYRCDCSRERIMRALISVGEADLTEMVEQDHGAEVKCHFCNNVYRFDEAELRLLLESAKAEVKE